MDIDTWLDFMKKNKQENIPMDFSGTILTPNEFAERVKTGQMDINQAKKSASLFAMKELLINRIKQRYEVGKLNETVILLPEGERKFTPEDIINEVNQNTKLGERFLLEEKGLMDELRELIWR